MKPLIAICLALVLSSYCSAITGNELVENAQRYDGKTITFEGEAIGDIMVRGNYAWINVNDGSRAIGIWAKKDQAKQIKLTGSYIFIGDAIRVTGTFHRACPEHGGDLDLHAKEIQFVKEGCPVEHPINSIKIILAIIFFVTTLVLAFLPKFRT